MKVILTEGQIKKIIEQKETPKNIQGEINQKFYDFLKANISIESRSVDHFPRPFVLLYIDGKSRLLNDSKKNLVSKLVTTFSDDFPNVPESSLRLTAKKFIDELKQQYFG